MKKAGICLSAAMMMVLMGRGCLGMYQLGENLLMNSDMEFDAYGYDAPFYVAGGTATQADDGVVGRSVHITARTKWWGLLGQNVPTIQVGRYYRAEGYFKMLNSVPGVYWNKAVINVKHKIEGDPAWKYLHVAENPRLRQQDNWVKLTGNFYLPENSTDVAVQYLVSNNQALDFALDSCTLREMIPDEDWEIAANEAIDAYRKGQVNVNVNITYNLDPSYVQFRVRQLSHDFPFSTVVTGGVLAGTWFEDETRENYKKYVYGTFNWGSLDGNIVWKYNERTQGSPNYDLASSTITALRENGMKGVRGKRVFCDQKWSWPSWLKKLGGPGVTLAVSQHITDLVQPLAGRLDAWEVYDASLTSTNIPSLTGDDEELMRMFREVQAADPATPLFLNNFGVTTMGYLASGLAHQANILKAEGFNPSIGCDSAVTSGYEVDPIVLKANLDILAEAEKPIWITGLLVQREDPLEQAEDLEAIMRVAFSHPMVAGIEFTESWSEMAKWRPNSWLVEGLDVQPNAAGWTVKRLLNKEWRTDGMLTLPEKHARKQVADFRAYFGSYEMDVIVNDEITETITFDVSKDAEPKDIYVNI